MAYHVNPRESNPPDDASGFHSSAWLIRVAASEQQAPDALQGCPVCGQPYLRESLLTLPQQRALMPDGRYVLVCGRCNTYSVGLLDAQDEAAN